MAWFGQGRDTVEWEEHRPDVLFYKWKGKEIKQGSRLVIRPGQKAIFYASGRIEGIFEEPGNYDIESEIVPFLTTLSGWMQLRGDTGLRAEVYFVNGKELMVNWGTRQKLMIPTIEVPSGIPVGCNGNLVIYFTDYLTFINNIAGVRSNYSLGEVQERIMGEIGPILAESILGEHQNMSISAITALQGSARRLGKKVEEELDKELSPMGFGVKDVNIISFNYPEEVQKMAEKVAGQSFVGDVNRYAKINMADGMGKGGSSSGGSAMEMMMGMQMAKEMFTPPEGGATPVQPQAAGDRFCTKCRKMVSSKYCPDCGTPTV